ncbi:DNA-binding domain-containing protein [Neobacillus sp. OS1-32]|uniref:DNA-binding domain-containing protein n=1 Tax=Neobacillus sp. OS1-32 TaxID=3070682 RepID=UPI0027E1453C|nr:DNA-binding domain-containing protein [Neobacillus sp. OS1-32]WML29614.1 DNA-binding domain-containing protein [Neobacillus sp. OS1-32]
MNFYIIDDDLAVTMILRRIVEEDMSNRVVGASVSPKDALNELMLLDVDIVLVDLLMPELNGIALVEALGKTKPELKFIMISQVRDSELREDAYKAGIEFFIDKPINIIEVRTIVDRVKQSILMEQKLKKIQNLLGSSSESFTDLHSNHFNETKKKVRSILGFLGITSEAGSADILNICQVMIEQNISFNSINFDQHFALDPHEKKIIFQRVRRAIKKGMVNLANLCQDDFENELTMEYANTLYGYKDIHKEILFLQGKSSTGGKVSLKQFFDGLVMQANN